MPTPLARFLRALGGGRFSPKMLRNLPKSIFNCTDPKGPDFDLSLRAAFDDLTPEEEREYQTHLQECSFCRMVHEDVMKRDDRELLALLKKYGIHVKPKKKSS